MSKKQIISILCVVAAIAVLLTVYFCFSEKAVQGQKNITLEVINSKGETVTYTLSTDALYLRQAMDQAQGLEYSETENGFGPMVTSVNGERAVYDQDGAYWGFYVNGEYCNYGISDQPVNDNDKFTIAYTKA